MFMEGKVHTRNLVGFLIMMGTILLACGLVQPQISTVEVTKIVPETQVVTAEVTRVVQRTVVVTSTPPPEITVEGITLPFPRAHHTATRLADGKILLVGGSRGPDEHLTTVEIYNPDNESITQAASLHTARHDHSATLLQDGRVLVIGGYNSAQQWLSDAEVYDPSTDTWVVVPPLYPHGVWHTATLMKDGRVLVVGGTISAGYGSGTEHVEIFDPKTMSWTETAPLEYTRSSHTAQLLVDGCVLIAGGAGNNDVPEGGDAFLYDPRTNTWTITGPMIQPPILAQSVRLLDGRVLVAGGFVGGGPVPQVLANVEIYDPVSNTWTAAAPLSEARYAFDLVLLPDGRALALDGARDLDSVWNEGSFVSQIEIYDPVEDRWDSGGDLLRPGAFAAAALLPDNRVWVTGGQSLTKFLPYTWLIGPVPPER
jgi:N-acetylneuraminic acid mutarotase